ncbi:carboxyl transferase domain-containing protein [Rhodococcus opacus]|uniref:carboxyl transferase domain-containing protein n=1 Tax=Rhodococcus opacus TaxID=37919 RepID=UPI0029495E01|nr:carboxyl transferase domain-containing protein [Rhodococcus opacus]
MKEKRLPGLLIANRGEVALRIIRTARDRGFHTVAVHDGDESDAFHVRAADEARLLPGRGAAAYLDIEQIVRAAHTSGCTMLHPGYGFASENPDLADACARTGITFVGPNSQTLRLFGDKAATRALAEEAGVPVLPATSGATGLPEALAFMDAQSGAPVIVKALGGGGGRGIRVVTCAADLDRALERCRSEALRGFGQADVYVERYLPRARHIEVQVLGDGVSEPIHLWDRECTIQRRHQKLIEIAPAPNLPDATRSALLQSALALARATGFRGACTFEFLVDADSPDLYYFIEGNPRLQVEHGVTEEITGVDLVAAQLALADGVSLTEQGLSQESIGGPRGIAVEARVTLEPAATTSRQITQFDLPAGPGIRVETHGHTGMEATNDYDPLLAKIIVHRRDVGLADVLDHLEAQLSQVVVEGVPTNVALLRSVLADPGIRQVAMTTSFVDEHLLARAPAAEGTHAAELFAPSAGTVVAVAAESGQWVERGDPIAVLEAMKMEYEIIAPSAGRLGRVTVMVGDSVAEGATVATLATLDGTSEATTSAPPELPDPDETRADVADIKRRHEAGLDFARPDAITRRHDAGKRTARENLADLFDPSSFREYGPLLIAAQRRRRSLDDLEANTPADGLVAGFGRVNASGLGAEVPDVAALAYDYTVLAGTQGLQNHKKAERMFELARRRGSPVVIFAEGGGGRPGDTDNQTKATGMDLGTFVALGRLNGHVPTVGIASGRCFAGNAALLGACDVVIATRDANIGMGGPAMIEGGGLGVFAPEAIGPAPAQAANGVVDVLIDDEAAAVAVARKYIGYFQGSTRQWSCADQRRLRNAVPERRSRVFDIRALIHTLADDDSVLELREMFGQGMVTCLARVEGRPLGIVANDGRHRGGAIDSAGADKMARFLRLCDTYGLPILSLCDTPGFMVGPEAEETAMVRHVSRLFVTGPNLSVPLCAIIVRKSYGLGGQAMAGGSFRVPDAMLAWPTGELGAMGPEGAVRLGFRRELDAIDDPHEREQTFRSLLADYEAQGRATNAASVFEIDDVIDPADTRAWIVGTFDRAESRSAEGVRRYLDTW